MLQRVITSGLCNRTSRLLFETRRWNIGNRYTKWPLEITQQPLKDFLEEMNYFERPTTLVNIGLDHESEKESKDDSPQQPASQNNIKDSNTDGLDVNRILEDLSKQLQPLEFNPDDAYLDKYQLMNLAMKYGIYRDLFGKFTPNRDHVKFTPEQAKRMNIVIPSTWITDQPFARVQRRPKQDLMYYFEPVVGLNAKFFEKSEDSELIAQTAYHGNIIPAASALTKPSITLDGSLLNRTETSQPSSEVDNWVSGQVCLSNFDSSHKSYYTVAMLNLDYLYENSACIHWMAANMVPSKSNGPVKYDEIFDYLPVHAIRGFGYSRFVLVVFQHRSKLDSKALRVEGFSLDSRSFDTNKFLSDNKALDMKPVGLSWFQSQWDLSSNDIFHNYMKMKAPVFEFVQYEEESREKKPYPGVVAFNVQLDHERDKKEINEQVLLERLKNVEYENQYVPPKVPETVFASEYRQSWMTNVELKKRNKVGYWRGLRPASAILPLNNNADLDNPLRPVAPSWKSPPEFPNRYPGLGRKKAHKDMPTSKPASDFESVYIAEGHDRHLPRNQ